MTTALALSSTDEDAMIACIAINTDTWQDIAIRFGVEEDFIKAKMQDEKFVQKVMICKEEAIRTGKALEQRATFGLSEIVLPRLLEQINDKETTADESCKIANTVFTLSGIGKKRDEKADALKAAPSIIINLGGTVNMPAAPALREISASSISINSDLDFDDVNFTEVQSGS